MAKLSQKEGKNNDKQLIPQRKNPRNNLFGGAFGNRLRSRRSRTHKGGVLQKRASHNLSDVLKQPRQLCNPYGREP